ncbi:hypothetical protein ACWDFL_36910 [Streptomyces bungoensis]
MTAEDPYDVRGGTIHFCSTGQQQTFTVFKRNGLWLFAITDWNTTPNTPGKQPLKDPREWSLLGGRTCSRHAWRSAAT